MGEWYEAERYHRDFYANNPMDPYSIRTIAPKLQV
jgi:peptide methionine sulfoxide reductase MsrA